MLGKISIGIVEILFQHFFYFLLGLGSWHVVPASKECLLFCYFFFQTMPWSEKTVLNDMHPTKSNDGPILWMRPGEQSIPTIELGSSPFKRRRYKLGFTHIYMSKKRKQKNGLKSFLEGYLKWMQLFLGHPWQLSLEFSFGTRLDWIIDAYEIYVETCL